ncbi:MAG: hypothetical protein ABII22_01005 [Candidatus Micrarchaeota archaeon]
MDYMEARLPKKGLKTAHISGHKMVKNYREATFYVMDKVHIELYRFERQDLAIPELGKIKLLQKTIYPVFESGVSGAYLFIVYSQDPGSKSKAKEILSSLAGEE